MFCNKPKSVNRNVPGKKNRKRKKKPTLVEGDKKFRRTDISFSSHLNIAQAMSTWAQNYTAATTWQLKHQVAYWKSRAVALQYENKILHEMIRDRHFKQPPTSTSNAPDSSDSDELENEDDQESESEDDENSENEGDENDELEVSEEFIEFLKQNAKYKEDARKERERLNAKHEADNSEASTQEKNLESSEEKQARRINLYGDNWEKILALETFMLCNFISECDKDKSEYWPNIPFNFNTW